MKPNLHRPAAIDADLQEAPFQRIFNATDEIQTALHLQAGCETALRHVLDPVLDANPAYAQMILALLESMGHWRDTARTFTDAAQTVSITATD